MAAALVISQYWAGDATNPGLAISELKRRLAALDKLPSHVTLVSAGEVGVLLDPLVIEFHQWLNKQCQVTFISAACTSLHAGILDFYHSDLAATLVISLELDKSFQQGCLNSLGIGNDSEQDGLDVVPGVGFIALYRSQAGKQPAPNELVVEQCQLFSQQGGITGTQQLIHQLYQALKDLPEDVLPVSFDICSNWGKSLLLGLNSRLATHRRPVDWLSSIETCQRHYLSLKPLFELLLYKEKLKQNSLLLFTLGGGGRVGMLQLATYVNNKANKKADSKAAANVAANAAAPGKLPEASFEHQSLVKDIDGYKLAMSLLRDDKSAYYQQIRATLKYPHSRYRGKDNHYFKWQIGLNGK